MVESLLHGVFIDSLPVLQHSTSSTGVCSPQCKGESWLCSGCPQVPTSEEQCPTSKVQWAEDIQLNCAMLIAVFKLIPRHKALSGQFLHIRTFVLASVHI